MCICATGSGVGLFLISIRNLPGLSRDQDALALWGQSERYATGQTRRRNERYSRPSSLLQCPDLYILAALLARQVDKRRVRGALKRDRRVEGGGFADVDSGPGGRKRM